MSLLFALNGFAVAQELDFNPSVVNNQYSAGTWVIWSESIGEEAQPVFIDDDEPICLVSLFEENNEDPFFSGSCNVGRNFIDFYMTAGEIWSFERQR